jgi:hypothetical protein
MHRDIEASSVEEQLATSLIEGPSLYFLQHGAYFSSEAEILEIA